MSAARPSQGPARRSHDRFPVQVAVHWHNRLEEARVAHIYDVSADGIFLAPEYGLPDSVDAGDYVWVALTVNGKTETLAGTVRWRGVHSSHHSIGCGIHLDGPSAEIIERLFPVVREG